MINRQLVNVGIDYVSFTDWAFSMRGMQFYLQSLVDMRMEPRWNPDLATASQIKADFFGRIMIAAKKHQNNINGNDLSDLVIRKKPGSLSSQSDSYHPFLPGPLEGAVETVNKLPTEIAQTIEKQLGAEEVRPSSFIALVNSALFFSIGADQAKLAARSLQMGSYRLSKVQDRTQLISILNGLATVAAVTRSRDLADELRVMVRRYRRDTQYALSIREAMNICLQAAASRKDFNDWREFVGDWITEFAFGDLDGDEGRDLHSHLKGLCYAAPELWVSSGRSDAALMAFNAI